MFSRQEDSKPSDTKNSNNLEVAVDDVNKEENSDSKPIRERVRHVSNDEDPTVLESESVEEVFHSEPGFESDEFEVNKQIEIET